MSNDERYKLDDFLPYIMSQAADALSFEFQKHYKDKYNMLRTEWRVLFHLGSFGELTAKEICERTNTHKTKVSRAVTALEKKGYLSRSTLKNDRRHSMLCLSATGQKVFADLRQKALQFDAEIKDQITQEEYSVLRKLLLRFGQPPSDP